MPMPWVVALVLAAAAPGRAAPGDTPAAGELTITLGFGDGPAAGACAPVTPAFRAKKKGTIVAP